LHATSASQIPLSLSTSSQAQTTTASKFSRLLLLLDCPLVSFAMNQVTNSRYILVSPILFTNSFCPSQALAKAADISSTVFSRTSDPVHHHTVQHVWRQLSAQGLVRKTNYSGWYSITDECFYTPRQVSSAPLPNNPHAHVALSTGSPVEWHEEQNYVFRLGVFRSQLIQYYLDHPDAIYPPQYHADIVNLLKQDNDDQELSISRPTERLSWGVPVPDDPSQTVYVWFDALLVYLSAIGYPDSVAAAGQQALWPPNLQVIGKDILR